MKITLYSNYLNHHQLPFCEALLKLTDGQFKFVAEDPITQVRLNLGYEDMNQKDFVVRAYESKEAAAEAAQLAVDSDIIIVGAASSKYIRLRNKLGKPSFRMSERPLKRFRSWFSPRVWSGIHRNKRVYMLCVGQEAAKDFAKLGAYAGRCYNWGYFPKAREYEDVDSLISSKKERAILWVGRFIKCKHAELVVKAAEKLRTDGYEFVIEMLGVGELRPSIRKIVVQKGLKDFVKFPGQVANDVVIGQMEKYPIFLMTSDKTEGWGAVINEAMSCGCAVVASDCIGAVSSMVESERNGLVYPFGDVDTMCEQIKGLLDNRDEIVRLGRAANHTISSQWNAEIAAERFLRLAESVLDGEETPDIYSDGPCSIIRN